MEVREKIFSMKPVIVYMLGPKKRMGLNKKVKIQEIYLGHSPIKSKLPLDSF